MEFNFEIQNIFPGRITVIAGEKNGSSLRIYDVESERNSKGRRNWTYSTTTNNSTRDKKAQRMKQQLESVIDEMGIASAKAQNLHTPVTSLKKLLNSDKQKVYVIKDTEYSKVLIGILKVGVKKLFVSDAKGTHHEVDPLCILDFYVHESKQRQGFGHLLFNSMLKAENVSPEELAIDRPSSKFLSFLQKHYLLRQPSIQANNFVIFPSFFQDNADKRNRKSSQPSFANSSDIDLIQANKRKSMLLNSPKSSTSKSETETQVHLPITSNHVENPPEVSTESEVSIQLPMSSDHINSSCSIVTQTAKLLQWDDVHENNDSTDKMKSTIVDNRRQSTDITTDKNKRNSSNWSVNDAMHSYQQLRIDVETPACSPSIYSPTTPVNLAFESSRQKWEQRKSSFNILGVEPRDYSSNQNSNLKDFIIADRPS